MPTDAIDTFNKWLVAAQGNQLLIMRPPQRLSHQDALLLAALLVTMVGDEDQWKKTLTAVENT